MKKALKKQVYMGIIYGMIPLLFFSCSSTKQSASSKTGKYLPSYADDKFKALYYDGLIQKTQGNYDKSEYYFRQCLSINPSSPAANYEMAQLMDYNKQPDSSLGYMKRAVTGDPKNIWYGYSYAHDLQEL